MTHGMRQAVPAAGESGAHGHRPVLHTSNIKHLNMLCKYRCKNFVTDYGFCRIGSAKPTPTGNPATCPYYERREP